MNLATRKHNLKTINNKRLPTAPSESRVGHGPLRALANAHPATAAAPIPVTDTVCAGVVDPDNDENVLKVRSDVFRAEWLCSRLLENNCYNIISNVALP